MKQSLLKIATVAILLATTPATPSLLSSPSIEETFKQCLISYQPSNNLQRCLGVGAITKLQSLDSSPEFDLIDGLTISRSTAASQEFREEVYNYADQDPSDFRSILGTFDHVFSKRDMNWDMSFLYPGLAMRVAPSVSPGGVLEFIIDPHYEAAKVNHVKELGTGRLLARQYLLPMLLGFKFNISSLLPLVFGLLVLLAKKIVFISKIALILSSAFGLGSLLFNGGHNEAPGGQYYGSYPAENGYFGATQYHQTGHLGTHYKGYNGEYPEPDLQYRGMSTGHTVDQLKLYGSLPDAFGDRSVEQNEQKKGRNFAWNEDEKMKKPV
ncbi:uncharacterized protein LOC126742150 [Anthonomus grandis grandis]|uniref:uncharacterized protein LOC126742150 n=1 Tax=Anthonomus grandis grandis TaxID=2921223 RepID=UPI002166904A|nr:uncharacterized protein LOC126742150 [Anthonomus grandis grandis]